MHDFVLPYPGGANKGEQEERPMEDEKGSERGGGLHGGLPGLRRNPYYGAK